VLAVVVGHYRWFLHPIQKSKKKKKIGILSGRFKPRSFHGSFLKGGWGKGGPTSALSPALNVALKFSTNKTSRVRGGKK